MQQAHLKLLAAAVLGLAPLTSPAATIELSDITGAQKFLNTNVGYLWEFTFSSPGTHALDVNFSLKLAPNTTADAVLSLYEVGVSGVQRTSTLLASNATQSFTTKTFGLSSYAFTTGTTYRLALTSSAATSSYTWYIKDPNDLNVIGNGQGISLNSAPVIYDPATTTTTQLTAGGTIAPTTASTTDVPDYAPTLPLAALGIGAALVARRRKA